VLENDTLKLDAAKQVEIVKDVAEALAYLHTRVWFILLLLIDLFYTSLT